MEAGGPHPGRLTRHSEGTLWPLRTRTPRARTSQTLSGGETEPPGLRSPPGTAGGEPQPIHPWGQAERPPDNEDARASHSPGSPVLSGPPARAVSTPQTPAPAGAALLPWPKVAHRPPAPLQHRAQPQADTASNLPGWGRPQRYFVTLLPYSSPLLPSPKPVPLPTAGLSPAASPHEPGCSTRGGKSRNRDGACSISAAWRAAKGPLITLP